MSQAAVAAGMDRLPWLADEPSPPAKRGNVASSAGWAIAADRCSSPARPTGWGRTSGSEPIADPGSAPAEHDRAASAARAPAEPVQPQVVLAVRRPKSAQEPQRELPIAEPLAPRSRAAPVARGPRAGSGRHCSSATVAAAPAPCAGRSVARRRQAARRSGRRGESSGAYGPARPDRRVRKPRSRPSAAGGYMVGAYPAVAHLPADRRRKPQLARPRLLSLPDRHDLAGAFRSAVPAHGEDRSQLRRRRACRGSRRASNGERHRAPYDEQLPWLQAVEDEDEPRGVSARKMLAALAVVLLAALLVAATFFWLGRRDAAVDGAARADQGPARALQGEAAQSGRARHQRRERDRVRDQRRRGQERAARPQQAGPGRRSQGRPQEQPSAAPAAAAPAQGRVGAAPKLRRRPKATGGAGSVIQLGAFANQAQAERAWTALSARFPAIAAMNKMIVPFPGGIRLRAGACFAGEAKQACQTLKAAGENCFVAQ